MHFRIFAAVVFAALLSVGGHPAFAHHSFAMFDIDNKITLTGVVREFQWTNPHVLIWVYVKEEDKDEPVTWAIEMSSVGNLRRVGWNRETLQPGDNVELVVNPLRNGQPGGGFYAIKNLDDGTEFMMPRTAAPEE